VNFPTSEYMKSRLHLVFISPFKSAYGARIILLILVNSLALSSYSQFEYYGKKDSAGYKPEIKSRHVAGDKNLSVFPVALTNKDFGVKIAGGVKLQIFISKRLSVDGDLVIGKDYIHTGPGIIAIPYWLLTLSGTPVESEEGDRFAGFLLVLTASLLSVEHFSYHIPLTEDTELAPYVSLLRFRFISDPELANMVDQAKSQLAFASGIQLNKYFGRFYFAPYAEYCIGYSDHIQGFNVGAGLGISFYARQ
jgi:hypothetical protein